MKAYNLVIELEKILNNQLKLMNKKEKTQSLNDINIFRMISVTFATEIKI